MKMERSDFTRFMNSGKTGRKEIRRMAAGWWKAICGRQENSGTKKSSAYQGLNYDRYEYGSWEWIRYVILAGGGIALIVYIFYRNMIIFLLLSPLSVCFPILLKPHLIKKRKARLRLQFKDAIEILAGSLNAGLSAENAMKSSGAELQRIYGKDSYLVMETDLILQKISVNGTLAAAMEDFALRSGVEEISNFIEIFSAAQKSGGEIMKIISRTSDLIGQKIQVEEEIRTMTSSRRMEQNLMNLIPLVFVLYLNLMNPGFFDILYETILGRIVMTICLLVYLAAIWMGRKILVIEL